jgi:hypothetical protein
MFAAVRLEQSASRRSRAAIASRRLTEWVDA